MFLDRELFEEWMRRIMERLERIEKLYTPPPEPVPTVLPDGEKLLDNHDLCRMMNVSKRTLQRYRSSGELPYQMIYHKIHYKESDVLMFIQKHFSSFRNLKKKKG